jgi:hypothetical protein
MKKWIKVVLILTAAILVVAGGIIGGIKVIEIMEEEKIAQEEAVEKDRIMRTYQKINYALFMGRKTDYDLEWMGRYLSLPDPPPDQNPYGVKYRTYLALKLYKKETGLTLTYEELKDYLSQEYEPDGTLRLYNNGRHPEIESYVEWMWEHREEAEDYAKQLEIIYFRYWREHRDEVSADDVRVFYSLSPQMYDELAKKEADPDYEMDLVSLQEQGL